MGAPEYHISLCERDVHSPLTGMSRLPNERLKFCENDQNELRYILSYIFNTNALQVVSYVGNMEKQ